MGRRGHIWKRSADGQWCMTEGTTKVPLGWDKDWAEREFHRRKAEAKELSKTGLTLEGLADHFADFLEREREPRTVEAAKYFLNSFIAHAGNMTPVAQVKPSDITAWLAARSSWGATTKSNGVAVVKRLFNWAKKEGLISSNPIKEVERPRAGKREDFITADEAKTILDAVRSPASKDLLVALRETGCRPVEIYTLEADRVNIEAGTWRVLNKTRRATGETYRTIYLNSAMIEMSRRLLARRGRGHVFLNEKGKPWTRHSIVKMFRRIRGRTGMGGEATAYAFRHLYITDALEKGVPPATVAELVGHTTLNMIMRIYNKLKHRTDHLREAAQMIRPAGVNPISS